MQQYGAIFFIFTVITAGTIYVVSHKHLSQKDEKSVAMMEELKQLLEATLANPSAIEATLRLNDNRFFCLGEGDDDCKNKGGSFILYSLPTRDPVPISQIAQERGFTASIASCNKFPSYDCPLRVETSWYPILGNQRCDSKHPIRVTARIILNNGSIFLDWKTEKIINTKVALTAKATCSCQGKEYLAGECRGIASTYSHGTAEGQELDRDADRENARRRENEEHPEFRLADCPPDIELRGEKIRVPFMGPNGETQIEVNSDDARCPLVDVYRYACTPRMENGKAIPQWTLTSVEKADCEKQNPTITTDTTIDANIANPPREPAANSTTNENNFLEIKQGYVPEERIEQ